VPGRPARRTCFRLEAVAQPVTCSQSDRGRRLDRHRSRLRRDVHHAAARPSSVQGMTKAPRPSVLRDAHPRPLHPPRARRARVHGGRDLDQPSVRPGTREDPPRGRRVLRPGACRPDHRDRRYHVRTQPDVTTEQVGRDRAGSSRRPVPARRSQPRQPSVRRRPALQACAPAPPGGSWPPAGRSGPGPSSSPVLESAHRSSR
jgi:hypothetical protein